MTNDSRSVRRLSRLAGSAWGGGESEQLARARQRHRLRFVGQLGLAQRVGRDPAQHDLARHPDVVLHVLVGLAAVGGHGGRHRLAAGVVERGIRGVLRHDRLHHRLDPQFVAGVAGRVEPGQHLPQLRLLQAWLVGAHDAFVVARRDIAADQQFLIEFLPRAQADELDLDVPVRVLGGAFHQPGHLDHGPGQIHDPHRLPHVQHEHLAAAGHRARLDHQLRGLGDQHEEADHIGVGDRDWPARFNLAAKQGNHGAGGPKHVAEADHREDRAGAGPCRRGLEDQLRDALARAHHVGGAHGLVGRDQHAGLHAEAVSHVGDGERAQHVVANALGHVALDQGHVLVGRGVIDGIDLLTLHGGGHGIGVAHRADARQQRHPGEVPAQILLHHVQRPFGMVEQDQLARLLRGNLAAQLAADGAARAGHHHDLAVRALGEQRLARRHGWPAKQVLDLDLADRLHGDLAVHQLEQGGQGAHAHGVPVQLVQDPLAPVRRQRGHRQHHFVDAQPLQLLPHARGMEHRQVGEGVVVQRKVVVEEAHGLMVDAGAHGVGELESGLAGAEDAHAPGRAPAGAAPQLSAPQHGADQEARDHDVGEGDEPVDQQAGARQPAVIHEKGHGVGQADHGCHADAGGPQHLEVDVAQHGPVQAAEREHRDGAGRDEQRRQQAVLHDQLLIAGAQQQGQREAQRQRQQVDRHHQHDLLAARKGWQAQGAQGCRALASCNATAAGPAGIVTATRGAYRLWLAGTSRSIHVGVSIARLCFCPEGAGVSLRWL
ncbi:hypothetical protein CNECB9_960031 [Cupriavidus necator]|uniref:Uncharacterized protein n=1 Tax=Cupriavidus necator TaxID=106590 RepID=A0A1K0ISN3_CUPNE|nr:hypothetical protein CNECB9_960031 [Cupriavidus necator]